ncbi:hypothetical protein GFK26_18630 [Variovorax paradoxus]|uniref:Uncharacterized protein n=1 Tax=Variovorax paradoxus TaxID=34073 RepID=A0A5Q0M7R5_VARPD|nr:RNA chaperone Hfq [Variovorax paradoxus]QFZ84644.1 hypothetical protein GFK26_18630 [Variovorax paradoxus]
MNTNVRPLHANRDVSREFPRTQDSRDSKPKFEAKGHDKQLQTAQYDRSLVEIETMSGQMHTGTLTRRDRYTVTLRDRGVERMYFKHAIESICIVPAAGGLPLIDDGKDASETGV